MNQGRTLDCVLRPDSARAHPSQSSAYGPERLIMGKYYNIPTTKTRHTTARMDKKSTRSPEHSAPAPTRHKRQYQVHLRTQYMPR